MPSLSSNPTYRNLIYGVDIQVPLLDGSRRTYINLDNAASTPTLHSVRLAIDEFLKYYSSVHRGTGFKSQLSTHAYEQARAAVLAFLGADPAEHVCIFGKNATEAINKLARRYPFPAGRDVVLVSTMEHHSNDLPWRAVAKVIHIGVTPEGRLDELHYDDLLNYYRDRIALVAISGASNVTGFINPIHRLAEKAHAVGAQIAVDAAQLAPHRAIQMLSLNDPAHLDYVSLSAHKMYAPFGTGALVGRRDTFQRGDPDLRGGGEVEIVTLEEVMWSDPPERDEAGSPNTVGAVALGAAIRQLKTLGMNAVAAHEAELTRYALNRLNEVPGLHIFGDADPAQAGERLGVIPVALPGLSHFLVAAVLGYEFGIGVRNGCFCAHPYLLRLFGLSKLQEQEVRSRILGGDRSDMPGLVRISFGLYNDFQEVDALIEALNCISEKAWKGTYTQNKATGEYAPEGWQVEYSEFGF